MTLKAPLEKNLFATPIFWCSCSAIFLFFSLSLTANGNGMFGDTDLLWHIATGDLIRTLGALPEHDPWSFTAGNYHWINISWAWDVVFSYIHEHLGWHGAASVNAMIIALVFVTVFITCLQRTRNFMTSFVTMIAAGSLFSLMLRPLQFSNLMVAFWLLLLGSIMRGVVKPVWLCVLPLLMIVWVNVHGGFLVGGLLIATFFFQALIDKNWHLAGMLFASGIATGLAMLCTPYGFGMYTMVFTQLTPVFAPFAHEWQPMITSFANLHNYFYVVAFPILVLHRPLNIYPMERWLAYLWFFLGLTSNRHLTMFAIIAAPLVACSLEGWFHKIPKITFVNTMSEAMLFIYNRWIVTFIALIACACVVILLPGPIAAKIYEPYAIKIPSLATEIKFMEDHYPHARLLNHYDLGGILVYETRGTLPVFVDPRGETSVPPAVMRDYVDFVQSEPGWEAMLNRYRLDGVMIPNKDHNDLFDRFNERPGWKKVFTGPMATIFMRVPNK